MEKRTLTIVKNGDLFEVDDPNVAGSPPVGRGRTIKEAVGDWLINNQDKLGIDFDTTAVQERIKANRDQALAQR